MEPPTLRSVAVLGLGEAGSAIAQDLAARGVRVLGWDPVVREVPGVVRAEGPVQAAQGADAVLSVNAARVALEVARQLAAHLRPGQLFCELNTASPALKRAVAEVVEGSGALFVDVALMAPVPGRGIRTPALVSGRGAHRFAELFRPLGMPVEVVDEAPGAAAARKLLRSVFMKGLAACVLEGLQAAERLGWGEWYRQELATTLREADEQLLERLISGSRKHAARRVHEMTAAAEFLLSLGVMPRVSMAAAEWLQELDRQGRG